MTNSRFPVVTAPKIAARRYDAVKTSGPTISLPLVDGFAGIGIILA
jgi:hypothetical protein